jgi:DNA (cytosine-5)-methyltransferase 1
VSVAAPPSPETDAVFLRRNDPPARLTDNNPIAVVDLFAGCGGLTIGAIEGARRAGRAAELVLAVDEDPVPLSVLQRTLGLSSEQAPCLDLEALLGAFGDPLRPAERALLADVPTGGLLIAGPPCQGHSALNNRTRHDDPRNDLYLAVARVARLVEPVAVIVENVRGVGRDRRRAADRCRAALEELGYETTASRVDLHEIGVPQKRIRHVLVAVRGDRFDWDLIDAIPGRDVRWAIEDLLDIESDDVFDSSSHASADNRSRIGWLFENGEYDLPNSRRPPCHRKEHSYVSMYGRLRWDEPAQTITTGFGSMGQGRFVHPGRQRTLTPHEAARLQFLPDYLRLGDVGSRGALARMIGNAAPPALAIRIVETLVRAGTF